MHGVNNVKFNQYHITGLYPNFKKEVLFLYGANLKLAVDLRVEVC
jgi:hypothetical protein